MLMGGAGLTPLTAPHHQRSSASAAASRAVGQIQKKDSKKFLPEIAS
jgi:hypothetical protein